MAKSKVIDGFSYEFDSLGKIIGVFDHSDPTNPAPVDPDSRTFRNQVRTNGALTAFNFNRYGGNKDSYEDDIELPSKEERDKFLKEKEEILRRRAMTEEERQAEDEKLGADHNTKKQQVAYNFMQKYYHKGAFY